MKSRNKKNVLIIVKVISINLSKSTFNYNHYGIRGKNVIHLIALVLLLFYSSHLKSQSSFSHNNDSVSDQIFDRAEKLKHQNPDSAIRLLQEAHKEFLKSGDTLKAIEAILEMPYVYGQNVDYAKSYDDLWRVLFLADDLGNQSLKASIYGHLGRFHSFYKRKEQSLEYLHTSLRIKKNLVKKGLLDKTYLVENYYLLATTYRELDEPKMGKVYLDSSFANYSKVPNQMAISYLQFEKAFIYSQERRYEQALTLMNTIEPWFEKNRPSYLVLIYNHFGDIYRDLSDVRQSEVYYKKALQISGEFNSHLDFTPLIYEKLASQYLNEGDYEKSLSNLKKAKDLDRQFFDSRSASNKSILEIKDEFRLEKERQERLIQKQRFEQLEQEDEILLLQRIILISALILLASIGLIYLRRIRLKHKAEKQLIKSNKKLEIQRAKESLELKNKELAAYALQLVEKDEFLDEIKIKLMGLNNKAATSEIKRILKSISTNRSNNWEEFKLRFTAVNEEFYRKVTTLYPKLNQADQKMCALIKLNFSSKETARLLGISVESVHTARYRLRKKMGLNRSVNLEDFIGVL